MADHSREQASLFPGRKHSITELQLIESIEALVDEGAVGQKKSDDSGATATGPAPGTADDHGGVASDFTSCRACALPAPGKADDHEGVPSDFTSRHVATFRSAFVQAHQSTVAFLDWQFEAVRRLEAEVAALRGEGCAMTAEASVGCQSQASDKAADANVISEQTVTREARRVPRSPSTVFPLMPGAVPPAIDGAADPTRVSKTRIQNSLTIRDCADNPPVKEWAPPVKQASTRFKLPKEEEEEEEEFTCNFTPQQSMNSFRLRRSRALWTPTKPTTPSSEFTPRALAMEGRRSGRSARRITVHPGVEAFKRKSHNHRGVFVQLEEQKERIRKAICKEEYSVFTLYSERGLWREIATSPRFDTLTIAVIAFNAVWMAVDTDINDKAVLTDAAPIFQVMEHFFCAFFSMEIFVRFMAFEVKKQCLKDRWFVFDATLAICMVLETWAVTAVVLIMNTQANTAGYEKTSVLRLVRLVRLLRMARMARLVRLMPELMILIKGMIVATQTVFYTLCLLMLFIYIFSIVFMQTARGTDLQTKYFNSMTQTMLTLLLNGILPDNKGFVDDLAKTHIVYSILMLLFILVGSLTVMNMLVGVLVEVVKTVSSIEKEEMDVNFVRSHLLACIHKLDVNQDEQISKEEFEGLLEMPDAARALANIGVDVAGLVDYVDYIFAEEQEVSFPKFMETVLQLRGSNTATVKDIVDMRKYMAQELFNLECKLPIALP